MMKRGGVVFEKEIIKNVILLFSMSIVNE